VKKIAIVQSNYIPWKGYFDLISAVDEFIIFDDMQYTRRDWRNRNLIKTPKGVEWLTVPVQIKGKYHQPINQTLIDGRKWAHDHLKALEHNYSRAPNFKEIFSIVAPIYLNEELLYLTQLNQQLIKAVCKYLEINTTIETSSDYKMVEGKTERLVNLCIQSKGDIYISGPSAKDYIDVQLFVNAGIKLEWFTYDGYKKYPQLWGDFNHNVTILDLLFNAGRDSIRYMKSNK
jgi:hypothetical protein